MAEARRTGHALGSGSSQPMIKLLLVLLKFAKFGPALKSAALMALSVGAYAMLFGWRYALGFVLLMLVHEMGHYVAARRLGTRTGGHTAIAGATVCSARHCFSSAGRFATQAFAAAG